jgi:hypothetical protein
VAIPSCAGEVHEVAFQEWKIAKPDWALAALCFLAAKERAINWEMLDIALKAQFQGKIYLSALGIAEKIRSAMAMS